MRIAVVGLAIGHVLWAGVPLMRRLLPGLPVVDAWILGPASSLGLATWLLTWIGLAPGQPLAGWGPALVWALVAGAGHFAARGGRARLPDVSMSREPSAWAAWLVVALFGAGAVYTALALPATHWDFLARYGRQALAMHGSGALGPEIHGYPPLVAMFYAGLYAGLGVEDGLVKVQALVYGVLVLALTHRLAMRPRRPWVARGAVLLVGLAPVVLNSPPCGDPDLALTFYATACLYLLLLESTDAPARLVVACGLQLGLALWAKQAAAPLVVTLVALGVLVQAGWLAHGWLTGARLLGVLAVGGALVAPWYLRNLALTGKLSELANLADSANSDRGFGSLFLVRWYEELGLAGTPFYMLGLAALGAGALAPGAGRQVGSRVLALAAFAAAGLALAVQAPPFDRYLAVGGALAGLALGASGRPVGLAPRATIACLFVAPWLLVWWARFAFTARYLMPLLPVLAAAGAAAGVRALGPLFRRAPGAWALWVPLVALVTLESAPVYRVTLAQALESRGLTRAECFSRIYPGPVYRVAQRIRAEAPQSRVATNDSRLGYFLDPAHPPAVLPRTPGERAAFDVLVVGPYGDGVFSRPDEVQAGKAAMLKLAGAPPWFSDGGYDVYRVSR